MAYYCSLQSVDMWFLAHYVGKDGLALNVLRYGVFGAYILLYGLL